MSFTEIPENYGTPEFYSNLFQDILADVQHDQPHTSVAILQGFVMAIDEWAKYHKNEQMAFEELRENLLNG